MSVSEGVGAKVKLRLSVRSCYGAVTLSDRLSSNHGVVQNGFTGRAIHVNEPAEKWSSIVSGVAYGKCDESGMCQGEKRIVAGACRHRDKGDGEFI